MHEWDHLEKNEKTLKIVDILRFEVQLFKKLTRLDANSAAVRHKCGVKNSFSRIISKAKNINTINCNT